MSKQIIADTFETLSGVVKSAGQQAVSDVKKAGEDVVIELGLKSPQQQSQGDQAPASAPTEEQTEKINEAAKKRAAARYREIQAEIKDLEEKREKQLPKEVSGKPGFDEEKTVKQLEVGEKPSSAQPIRRAMAGKEKLPPLPVQRASKKAEMFRGTSG